MHSLDKAVEPFADIKSPVGADSEIQELGAYLSKAHRLSGRHLTAGEQHSLVVLIAEISKKLADRLFEIRNEVDKRASAVGVNIASSLERNFGATRGEAAPFAEDAIREYREKMGEPAIVSPAMRSAIWAPARSHLAKPAPSKLRRRGQHVRCSHGAKTLRSRGCRRVPAAVGDSGDSDSSGGGEPPPSPSSRRHSGSFGMRALAGGIYSLVFLVRAVRCTYAEVR